MFVDDDDDDDDKSEDQVSESEFVDWIEPPLQLCNTRLLQPYMLDRFYDAFHQFQTDPSVQVLCFYRCSVLQLENQND